MNEHTTGALLAAINVVNDNVMANRTELSAFRQEISATVKEHGDQIALLKEAKVAEKAWLRGAKYPFVLAGGLALVLIDHWEHGKALFALVFKK